MEGLGIVYEPVANEEEEEEEVVDVKDALEGNLPPTSVESVQDAPIDYNDPSCFGKLFVGGLSWDSTEETLQNHFQGYGTITEVALMKDKYTGQPRGFGFVTFNNAADLDKVLADPHKIDGRTVEVKKAVPKDRAPGPVSEGGKGQGQAPGKRSSGPSAAGNSSFESKKIFVGGLPSSVKDEDFKQYFQSFGKLVDAVVMIDRTTKRSRGFGFVTFEEEGAVAEVLSKSHQIHDKSVEIKRAEPKEKSGGGRGNRSDGGGGGRGGYGYGYGYGAPVGGRGGYGYGGGYGAGGYGGYPPAYGGGGYGGYGGYGAPPGAGGYGYPPPPYGGEGADASGPGGYGGGYGYGGYGGEQGGYGGYPPPAYGGGYGGPGGEGDDPRGGSPGQSGEDAQQYNSSRPNGRSDRYRPY